MNASVAVLTEAIRRGLENAQIEPGEYPLRGEVTLELDCVVGRREDVLAYPAITFDAAALAAAILCRSGISTEKIGKLVEASALEVANGKVPSGTHLDLCKGAIDRARAKVREGIRRTKKDGATTVTGDVKIVDFIPAVKAEHGPAVYLEEVGHA